MTSTADERAGAPDGPRRAGRTGGRRAEILQRATECFDRLGYANTTLDDIARAVGIKREGIYYYFKNRGQILLEIIEPQSRLLVDGVAAVVGDASLGPQDLFFFRVHSPVIIIEFDHQGAIALPDARSDVPIREHIHTVVRTPNGNDYGKDLLRLHYEQYPH